MKKTRFSKTDLFREQMRKQRKDRANAFKIAIKYLENIPRKNYLIIETGTIRSKNEWYGDGQSTIIFDEFVNFYDGRVISIDNDKQAVMLARKLTSDKVEVICGESVDTLYGLYRKRFSNNIERVNLLYLDSWGWDSTDQDLTPQAIHTFMELAAIMGYLRTDSLIMVDDNLRDGRGKGMIVRQYAEKVGWKRLYDGYVILYRVG
jgi:hypothetical protein